MTTTASWVLIALAFALGAVIGGLVALRLAGGRFDARLCRAAEELEHKHAAATDELRAAQARTQAELEQSRNTFKRQLAAAADEPRAAMLRAEERLIEAYAEIDRLRRGGRPADAASSEFGDGFAATRPMQEGM